MSAGHLVSQLVSKGCPKKLKKTNEYMVYFSYTLSWRQISCRFWNLEFFLHFSVHLCTRVSHTLTHAHTHSPTHIHSITHAHTHTHTCTYKCTLETTNRWLIFSDSLSTTNFILTRKKFSIAKTMKISNVRGYIFQTVSNLHILHIPNTTIFRTTSKHFPCEKNNEHIRFSRVHFPNHVKCQHLAFSKHSNL